MAAKEVALDVVDAIKKAVNDIVNDLPAKIGIAFARHSGHALPCTGKKYRIFIPAKSGRFKWEVHLVSANGVPIDDRVEGVDEFYWIHDNKYYKTVPRYNLDELIRHIRQEYINGGKWEEPRHVSSENVNIAFKMAQPAVECDCPEFAIRSWRQLHKDDPRISAWLIAKVTSYFNVYCDGKELLHTSNHAFPAVRIDHLLLELAEVERRKKHRTTIDKVGAWARETPYEMVSAVNTFVEKYSGPDPYLMLTNDYNRLYVRNMELEAKLVEDAHKQDLLNAKIEILERRSQMFAEICAEHAQPMAQDMLEPFLQPLSLRGLRPPKTP
jgi:hypothetical protein